jgi:hypothetical protein
MDPARARRIVELTSGAKESVMEERNHGVGVGISRPRLWASRALAGAAVVFLVFDAAIKLAVIPPVVDAFAKLGMPVALAQGIGILELFCVALFLFPATAARSRSTSAWATRCSVTFSFRSTSARCSGRRCSCGTSGSARCSAPRSGRP